MAPLLRSDVMQSQGISGYFRLLTGFRLLPQYWGWILGSFFYGGVSPSKIGPIAPYWETVQALSKARAFLLSWNKRKLLFMGRTYAAKRQTLIKNWRATVWAFGRGVDLNPARVIAREAWHDWKYLSSFIQKSRDPLSIEWDTCTGPN
jgi:hypothetical protein